MGAFYDDRNAQSTITSVTTSTAIVTTQITALPKSPPPPLLTTQVLFSTPEMCLPVWLTDCWKK